MIRKNFAYLVIVTATLIVMLSAYTYNAISSKLIFKESATHLNEIYTQVGYSLSNLLSENWNAMDMWIPYLEDRIADFLGTGRTRSDDKFIGLPCLCDYILHYKFRHR